MCGAGVLQQRKALPDLLLSCVLVPSDIALQVTLQYCLWDQWKEVANTEARRLMCLAGLVAHVLANFVLPLSALRPVSLHWRGEGGGRLLRCRVWAHRPSMALSAAGWQCMATLQFFLCKLAFGEPKKGLLGKRRSTNPSC